MEPFIAQILMFGGNFAPRGWAFCDGQLLPISQYSALFSLLGTTYGGDGRTTFGLPDLRGRVALHPGNGPGLPAYKLGQKGGEPTHTLTIQEMPSHNHIAMVKTRGNTSEGDDPNPAGRFPANSGEDNYSEVDNTDMGESPVTINNNGGSATHNNMQPFLCVNYIIALQGIYPSRN